MEDRAALERKEMENKLGELTKAFVTSESLTAFQEVLKNSFSEVVNSIGSFSTSSSTQNFSNLATKDDMKLIMEKLLSIEKKQEALDTRLKALECRPQSEISKRKHDDQDPDDHVGEKRRKISETERVDLRVESSDVDLSDILEKNSENVKEAETSEAETSEAAIIPDAQILESSEIVVESSEEVVPVTSVDEGYETEKLSYESEMDVDSDGTEKLQDSSEEMLNEYLAIEEEIGESGDLSDVIVFEDELSENEGEGVLVENNVRELIVWNQVNMIEVARIFNEGVLNLWRWFMNLLILNSGLLNPTWNLECRFMYEGLSIFKEFYNQPTLEAEIVPDYDHMEFVYFDDEDFVKFTQRKVVKFKKPIVIPRINLPIRLLIKCL